MAIARKLGLIAMLVAIALPASASSRAGAIAGVVRDAGGTPQMGAAVEIITPSDSHTTFTDAQGRYTVAGLLPGLYQVKVSAPSFLPSMREGVTVGPGAHLVINLTLNTLFEAAQFLPSRPRVTQDDDDWKWTLRSSANRPILRIFDEGPVVVREGAKSDRGLKANVMFLAGSSADGFGGTPAMGTAFSVEQSIFSAGTLAFNGNIGYGNGPAGVVRASYAHQFADGSRPEFAFTARRFGSASSLPGGDLQAFALSGSDTLTIADVIELAYGGELQTIQLGERVSAFRPSGAVTVHVTPNTVVEYRYATSEPNLRSAKGFDTAPADLSESGPRMSMNGGQPALERAHHHEISVSRRVGRNNIQVAWYSDQIDNAALVGVGEVLADASQFLPDLYSGTFSYNGGNFSTNGARVVYSRKLAQDVTATVDYTYGGAPALEGQPADWQALRASLRTERRHAVTGKFAGSVPHCKTRWIASYKWTSGEALTPVDLFNTSPGQADPYLEVFLRQPLPTSNLIPGKMEALVDVRNLLAQGYVPVVGPDGQTVFLVQAARSVRAGLAFTF